MQAFVDRFGRAPDFIVAHTELEVLFNVQPPTTIRGGFNIQGVAMNNGTLAPVGWYRAFPVGKQITSAFDGLEDNNDVFMDGIFLEMLFRGRGISRVDPQPPA